MPASDYIAYFDESGDHGLAKIDKDFPVFVLCGWIYKVKDYCDHELGKFSAIKFEYFGHDAVVFHSRDIRKQIGPFQILTKAELRTKFMTSISNYFESSKGVLIASVINKQKHVANYVWPDNPYSISLLFCLERLYGFLKQEGATDGTMFCVFEERGPKEDAALALEFQRICGGSNMWGPLPFKMVFASKLANMPGLQAADLAAYPIARKIIKPEGPNPAYDVIEKKFRRSKFGGKIHGYGLKVFP
jgi:hypothetical protein